MLKLNNLCKSFDEKIIFDHFSYTFENKGLYLIRGKSGIGKTTLLRMIAGLDRDYDGEIEGGGPHSVSVAFQEYRLFDSLNALENVLVAISSPTEDDIEKAKALLIGLGICESDMLLFPRELSGGMKLRVSIARAILKTSPILLLDEPTRELDDASADAVIRLISEEALTRTVIVVTHDDYATRLDGIHEILIS